MASVSNALAQGCGWKVEDALCSSGPDDRPFEEQHRDFCVAIVTDGSFQYRSENGRGLLGPGSVLLGNTGGGFECAHEHGIGDRCLAFHFDEAVLEQVVRHLPRHDRMSFRNAHIPALPNLTPRLAAAEAARDRGDPQELEEVTLELIADIWMTDGSEVPAPCGQSSWDEARVSTALRFIEARWSDPLTLLECAREAGMSAFHFLRTFKLVVGMTPYQYILRTRLHQAARRLRRCTEPISSIAFECGFGDLSTFNRHFRNLTSRSPREFRKLRRV